MARHRRYPQFCQSVAGNSRSREAHEFQKHGTCTKLSHDKYFAEEKRIGELLEPRATGLVSKAGGRVATTEITTAFGGDEKVAVSADRQCRLKEITTCWNKRPGDDVGEQTNCPSHILGSGRNSAVLMGCKKLAIDLVGQCLTLSKEAVKDVK